MNIRAGRTSVWLKVSAGSASRLLLRLMRVQGAEWLLGPQAREPSPLAFFGSLVAAAMLMRAYAYFNRGHRHQKWFIIAGLVSWLVLSSVTGLDLLASSLCTLSWTMLICLLCSDAFHVARRVRERRYHISLAKAGSCGKDGPGKSSTLTSVGKAESGRCGEFLDV